MGEGSEQRERCSAEKRGRPCKNFAVNGGKCALHDPDQRERWARAGRKRKPRFGKAMLVGDHVFDRARAPTIAHLVDRLMGIADSCEAGKLDPRLASAAISAIRGAHAALVIERERADKLKFAWEREGAREGGRAPQSTDAPPAAEKAEGSSAEGSGDGREPVIPPWMRAKPPN
jgi:hypothetical protein